MLFEPVSQAVKMQFLEKLIELTQEGKVVWSVGAHDFWFKAAMKNFTYTISSEDMDDLPPYSFKIYEIPPTGSRATPPIATWDWESDGSAQNNLLATLYRSVKRTLLGSTRLQELMLEDLDLLSRVDVERTPPPGQRAKPSD